MTFLTEERSGITFRTISAASSIYKKAEVHILDEPTAALDPKIEYDLYQKYNQITRDKLSFFVSHRLGSCRFANRILVFDKGFILEDGTHEELITKDGKYRELFENRATAIPLALDGGLR